MIFAYLLERCTFACTNATNYDNAAFYNGLTLDTEHQKLYYAEESITGGKVGELWTNGTGHQVLINGGYYSRPLAVVFHSDNR